MTYLLPSSAIVIRGVLPLGRGGVGGVVSSAPGAAVYINTSEGGH